MPNKKPDPVIWISLSDLEWITEIAHGRNDDKIRYVTNRRVDQNQSDIDMNVAGLAGELAVARFLGVSVDTTFSLSGDNGSDIHLTGKTIQVKFNTYPRGDLYFNTVDDLQSEIAVLTVPQERGSLSMIRLAGWIRRTDFSKIARMRDWGYGQRMCVDQGRLSSLHELKPEVEPKSKRILSLEDFV